MRLQDFDQTKCIADAVLLLHDDLMKDEQWHRRAAVRGHRRGTQAVFGNMHVCMEHGHGDDVGTASDNRFGAKVAR